MNSNTIFQCTVKGVPLTLMTSHLESTKTHSAERKRQLSAAFKHMSEAAPNQTVIFGGDLNLRDKEVRGKCFDDVFFLYRTSHLRCTE